MALEEQFFISDNPRLFGVLYPPEIPNGQAVLIVHPFAEEKKSSQRTLVQIAKALSSQGAYVLLFDLRGCGDSEGDMNCAGISEWTDDMASAAEFLRKKSGVSQISVIGLRLGAYLSLLYSAKNRRIDKVILIAPVLDSVEYLRKSLRSKLMKELITDGDVSSRRDDLIASLRNNISIDFDGYPITGYFYSGLLESIGEDEIGSSDMDTVLVDITITGRTSKQIASLQSNRPSLSFHTLKMEPFWERIERVDVSDLISLMTQILDNAPAVHYNC